ncbi:MAG TPA: SH3 domain-containing protein [Gemmatimonadales bacterium]|nr:SH3 domain-containing protein [Gemmatimonadales bacterium]
MRATIRLLAVVLTLAWVNVPAPAQTVTVVHNVNLRPDPSSEYPPIRLLTPAEPALTLLDATPESGYYRVITSTGDTGYVWSHYVRVNTSLGTAPTSVQPGPGVPGSTSMAGCGDSLWQHVYHPARLLVLQDCVTVTGTIVDATANQAQHQPDGVRHEADGDTHGWLKVDSQFANLINAGNSSAEDGNLVFEIVCHYTVSQADAKPSCLSFTDHTVIPPVGAHVAMTGTLVKETNHQHWNEIHPVSRIVRQ